MSKPSLPFPLAAFEFLINALVLVIIAFVYGTGTGECRVFQKLLKSVPHLEERLVGFSNEEAMTMVPGQPERQVENGTASRGVLDGMLKQRDYGRSGMLHTHVASSRCSSIWSQVQNGVLSARSDDTKSLKGVLILNRVSCPGNQTPIRVHSERYSSDALTEANCDLRDSFRKPGCLLLKDRKRAEV
jgi:GTP cyclohydrolase II